MSPSKRRSQSPRVWREGGIGEASTCHTKTRISYDSPRSRPWREERDEMDGGHGEESEAIFVADEKAEQFHQLLSLIETEHKKIMTPNPESSTLKQQRLGSPVAKPRRTRRCSPSSASSNTYDYADRARELRNSLDVVPARLGSPKQLNRACSSRGREQRMSLDGAPARSETPIKTRPAYGSIPIRSKRDKHFARLARDMTRASPSKIGGSIQSRSSFTSTMSDDEEDSGYNHTHCDSDELFKPHASRLSYYDEGEADEDKERVAMYSGRKTRASSTSVRSRILDDMPPGRPMPKTKRSPGRHDFSQRARDMSPRIAGNALVGPRSPRKRSYSPEFRIQVEDFHTSLMAAHETITTLEKVVRSLKRTVGERDGYISSLEHRHRSLNETLDKRQDEVDVIYDEMGTFEAEKKRILKRHTEELEKLQFERDEYKNRVGEIDKISAERYATAVGSVQDKETMIANLRNEIKGLNEELADGSFVRSQALKAEQTAKTLEAELEKSKTDHASVANVLADLEVKFKEKSEEFDGELKKKDTEIATLQSNSAGSKSLKESAERMKNKVGSLESQLDESKLQNEELSGELKELEDCLDLALTTVRTKEEDIKRLGARSESRENDLKRQLEKKQRELESQRERFEKCDINGATEQKVVAALEEAIGELERAHNESNSEIGRLQEVNHSLTATLADAEDYMKLQQQDVKNLKDVNSNLSEKLKNRTDAEDYMRLQQHDMKDLKDINSNLNERLNNSDGQISDLKEHAETLRTNLENIVAQKQEKIYMLQEEVVANRSSHDQEMTELYEETESELEELRTTKGTLLQAVSNLQNSLDQLKKESKNHALGTKLDHDREFRVQQDVLKTLQRKLSVAEQQPGDSLKVKELQSMLASVDEKLAARDEQLKDSRKGIAEAQIMIFRLMKTVQELRKNDHNQHHTSDS